MKLAKKRKISAKSRAPRVSYKFDLRLALLKVTDICHDVLSSEKKLNS